MDEERPPKIVGDAGQRSEGEIVAPADRLEDPEGPVLVLEEGLVEPHSAGDGVRGRLDFRCVGETRRGAVTRRSRVALSVAMGRDIEAAAAPLRARDCLRSEKRLFFRPVRCARVPLTALQLSLANPARQ